MSGYPPTGPEGPAGSGQPNPGGFGQPSGPGYGGPGGYPGQAGGPSYGPPGPPPPNGPYGPPPPNGPYGPGQPGGPGYGGPTGPGGPYGPGGGQPPNGKRNPKLLLILGAAALALILLVVGATALINRVGRGSATAPANPGAGSGGSPTGSRPSAPAPVPGAAKASDAVRGYLQALAAGKAETALAYAANQPADKTFLTDAVLAESNRRAPITAINVPDVTNEYAYSVDASYRIGDEAVSQQYSVTKSGGKWQLRDAVSDVSVKYVRSNTVPLLVNKVAVKTDKIRLFPGSYDFTSNNPSIDYGSDHVLVLKSPSDFASTSEIKPSLTEAGRKAFTQAILDKLQGCAKDKVLAPPGCPNGIRELSFQKIDERSVRWSFDKSSLDNLKPELEYDNPAVAKAGGQMTWNFSATGKQSGDRVKFRQSVERYVNMRADITRQPVKVVLS